MTDAVIIDAVRTPGGKRNGKLRNWHAADLASETLKALVERNDLDSALVDDVIMGCVMQVGEQSLNVGRNAVLAAGFPESVPATTLDRQCGSSQQAQHFGAQGVLAGAYDGVIAGSAGMNWTGFMAQDLWQYQAGALPSGKRLSAEAIALAHKAVVSACDRLDGLADGLIANPLACHWKPDALLCKTGSAPGTCLSAEEIAAIERIEAPMRDPRTGEVAYYGMAPGSELLWTSPNGQIAALNRVATDYYRYMVARDPKWSATDGLKSNAFDIWRASKAPGTPGARIDSINPDIAAFRDRGGKLIQYHGWSDQAMSPGYSVKY